MTTPDRLIKASEIMTTPDRLIKAREVCHILGTSIPSLYRGIKSGKFPHPIKRGPRDTVWPLSQIMGIVEKTVANAAESV